jgi:hypothetical protein
MSYHITLLLFLILPTGFLRHDRAEQAFDRANFYSVMSNGKNKDVNDELTAVRESEVKEKSAYEGALLMRKAGLMKIPAEKLHYFKLGYIKLEGAISDNPKNAEYRFLRLTIQENAPHIVKYYHQIAEDKAIVVKDFKDLSPDVREAVREYSKTSKVLTPQNFQ